MLTPPDPGLPPASLPPPKRYGGGRYNRIPGLVAVGVITVIAGAFLYTLYDRSQLSLLGSAEEAVPTGADATGILKDAPSGYIAAPVFTRAEATPVVRDKLPASDKKEDTSTPQPENDETFGTSLRGPQND